MSNFSGRRGNEPNSLGGENPRRVFRLVGIPLTILVILIIFVVLFALAQPHFYFFKQVREDQIGFKTRGGKITGVVPPGI